MNVPLHSLINYQFFSSPSRDINKMGEYLGVQRWIPVLHGFYGKFGCGQI